MFKKTIPFLILLTVLMMSLAACSGADDESSDSPVEAESSVVQTDVVVEETAVVQTDSATETESEAATTSLTYPIVDTNQGLCYDGTERIDCPAEGEAFYGQDAQYTGIAPSYTDNGDGTITDNVTGLVWTQEISSSAMPWSDAADYCESLETGTVADWHLPSVTELWSLRDYSQGWPWIDTDYFYLVGDGSDLAQHHSWSNNLYLVESDYQNEQVEGDPAWIVNDWTGHIKAMSGSRFVRCVSGDEYGINDFVDNGDGTVTDNATGLMWSQDDNGEALYWEEALAYAESATIASYDDWRLPSTKELQSIADYTATEIPVLDTSVFNLTEVTTTIYDADEVIDTQVNYPFYWTNTSNPLEADGEDVDGGTIYAWALASGYNVDMAGYDLHGAGSIVFISKTEENSGVEDVVPVMVRLVRNGDVTETPDGNPTTINPDRVIVFEDGDTGMERGGDGGQMPDFAAAAVTLGVTEDALMEAMGEPGEGPDFEATAEALGVTVEELEAALSDSSGAPEGDAPEGEGQPPEGEGEAPAEDAPAEAVAAVDIGNGRLFTIPGDNVFPEGVSYDESTGKFYVGATSDGTLYVGDVNGDLDMTIFSEGGADGRTAAVGTKVDDDGRLWVAGGGTGQVFVYDTADGSPVATITTPASGGTFINDLAITDSGVYFTDSFRPILWRVTDIDQGEAEAWLDFTGTAINYVDGFNLNGIVPTEDGSSLIVVHSGEGALYHIDVATQEVTQIDTGTTPLTAGDGLALIDNTIYVTRNSFGEIVPLELSADLSTATSETAITSDLFGYPTTIAYTGDSFLVANSQFNNRGAPNLPFTVAQIPLP